MKLDRPILVTGTPRTGKSLVARVIALAPEFQYVYEPLTIWDSELGIRDDDRRSADEVTSQLQQSLATACEALLTEPGKTRYVDALSYHALRLPFVHRIMPEAKIIHVIRDPIDVIPEMLYGWTFRDSVGKAAARRWKGLKLQTLPLHAIRFAKNYVLSRLKGRRATWGPRVPGMRKFAESHSIAEVSAYQWLQMIEIAMADLAGLPNDKWLELRFDKLLASPQEESMRIAKFCEVEDIDQFVKATVAFIDPSFKFEKKVHPTADEWEAIEKLISPLQSSLGYRISKDKLQR